MLKKQMQTIITDYLTDHSVTGFCEALRESRPWQAYRIPRRELKNCDDEEELYALLHSPGVYFMFGQYDESAIKDKLSRDFVYIGEGTDVLRRIRIQHTFEKEGKGSWQDVVVLVAVRSYFDETKIKYLEKRFIDIANKTRRYDLVNENKLANSNNKPLKHDLDTLEEIIEDTKLFLFHLGHRVLEPQPSQTNIAEEDKLFFSWSHSKTASTSAEITSGKAIGVRKEDGFWVLKGSVISKKTANYLPSGYKELREQNKKKIDKKQRLMEDIVFNSPSAASSFVCGRNSNGLTDWKNKDGVSLKELDAEEFSSESTGLPLPTPANRNRQNGRRRRETALPANIEVLSFASKKYPAQGYYLADSNEFVVLKGSKMNPKQRNACDAGIANERDNLVKTGKVKKCEFKEDVTFSSPSKAASVIAGGNSNGWDLWKDRNGRKLKDIIKR